MKQNHLIDYQEAANWFAISNGNESDEYAALISDLQKEIEDINTEIMSLSKMKERYSNIKCPTDRLKYLLTQHLLTAFPKAQELKPIIKKRKFKKEE